MHLFRDSGWAPCFVARPALNGLSCPSGESVEERRNLRLFRHTSFDGEQGRTVTKGLLHVASTKDGGDETAERYAQAGLELAIDAGALDALDADLKAFDTALAESADLRAAAQSPLIDPVSKSRALVAVAKKIGCSKLGADFIGVIAQNGRAALLPAIGRSYRKLLAAHRGVSTVDIVSAQPLSQADLKAILDGLAAALGGKVEAATRVDEALIGGFIVQVGSRQFDASLRSKLSSLKQALKA